MNKYIHKFIRFLTFSGVFVLSIFLTVGISSVIAFGAPPTVSNPNLAILTVGKALTDNFGLNIFSNGGPYQFLKLDYQNSVSPTGAGYAVTVESDKSGANLQGYNMGVLGQNAQNAAGDYGRTGVVGQVITPSQGVGRGILGFVEDPSPGLIPTLDPNAIPNYPPIPAGDVYGLYGSVGDARFGDVVTGYHIISSDGTVEIEGDVEFLDDLDVINVGENSGTLTADRFVLDATLYNNSQKVNTYFAPPSGLTKMLFTTTNSSPMYSAQVQTITATCPTGSVRVSCNGYMTGTSGSTSEKLTRSSLRGVYPSGTNGCRAAAQKDGGGTVHVEAICMMAEQP